MRGDGYTFQETLLKLARCLMCCFLPATTPTLCNLLVDSPSKTVNAKNQSGGICMFTPNEGAVDRVVRIIAGIVLIVLGFFMVSGTAGTVLGFVGFVPLVTGLIGWCPAYVPFRINTRKS
jgi:hypothetical protein